MSNNVFTDAYICFNYQCEQQLVAAIFVRMEERDLLSLISLGIEFQRNDPSYIKLFFKLLIYVVAVNKEYTWNVSKIIARVGGSEVVVVRYTEYCSELQFPSSQ